MITGGKRWIPGPDAQEDARVSTLDVDGPVHLREFAGPPGAPTLLCLHGLGGSSLNYLALAPLLTDTYRVVALDLPGHGGSRPSTGDVLADVDRVLDRVLADVTPTALVGHSLGGVLALRHLAAARPVVDRLVLLDPPVPTSLSGSRDLGLTARLAFLRLPWVGALVARQLRGMSAEEVVRRQLDQATPHGDRVPAEARAATVAETAERAALPTADAAQATQWRLILATLGLLSRPREWQATLARVAVPVLWLQGADDKLALVDHARALAATRPGWTFEVRDGVGHLPHLEDAPWTAEQVRGFLGS